MSLRLKDKASIKKIIKVLTTEEKALLLTGRTSFSTFAIEKYGIPSIMFLDSANGINFMQYYMELMNHISHEKSDQPAPEGPGAMMAMVDDMKTIFELMVKGLDAKDLGLAAEECARRMKEIMPGGKYPTAFPNA